MKPLCKLCGARHWTYEAHDLAINKRLTGKERLTDAINIPRPPAINGEGTACSPGSRSDVLPEPVATEEALLPGGGVGGGMEESGVAARTPNRRSREPYNAYMKDYMRAYRERKPTTS